MNEASGGRRAMALSLNRKSTLDGLRLARRPDLGPANAPRNRYSNPFHIGRLVLVPLVNASGT